MTRATRAWYSLYRDSRGRVVDRMAQLSDRINTPTRLKDWRDVGPAFRTWEIEVMEFESITGVPMEKSLQATAFLRMLPLDLRDKVLSQDGIEGDFERIRDYVLNQVGRHTAEMKTTRQTGAAPMDCSSLEHSEDVPEPAAANWFNNGKNRPGSFQTRTGKGGSGGKSSRCVGCGSNEHTADDCPRLTGKGPQAT